LSYLAGQESPVIHRDIKPGNIKITYTGEIFLVDFGLAKIMDGSQVTSSGARAMTPGYSPPEQYGTGRTDTRSDIYSLGATLYAAVSGTIPEDALSRITGKAKLSPIHDIVPEIDRGFEKTILKAMEIEAQDRFQTPQDFKNALLDAEKLPSALPLNLLISPPPLTKMDSDTKIKDHFTSKFVTSTHFTDPLKFPNQFELPTSKPNHPIRNLFVFFIFSACILLLFLGIIFTFQQKALSDIISALPISTPVTISLHTMAQTESQPDGTHAILASLTPPTLYTVQPTNSQNESRNNYPLVGGGASQIAFSSDRTSSYQLWIMNANGTGQKQLTSLIDGACQPNWSPDGQIIAFISPCREKLQLYKNAMIYFYTLENGKIEPMPQTQAGDFNPSWAPDGQRIAFSSTRNGVSHIFLYSFLTDSVEELSDTRYADMQPAWHPDGKQIAISRKIYFPHIWVISDTGVSQFQFSVNGNVLDIWPDWSPDGNTLLYTRSQESPNIPWLVSQDYEDRGKAIETKIQVNYDYIQRPTLEGRYSPDGEWILFESWPDGNNHDLYIMDIQGKNIMRLTTDPGSDMNAVWRPAIQ
jgi:Tol biopolymer transport system component